MYRIFIYFYLLTFFACSKEAGSGGFAEISGRVYAYNLNSTGGIADSSYIGDERIFISYGDHTIIDDEEVIIKKVTITEKKQDVKLDDFKIFIN